MIVTGKSNGDYVKTSEVLNLEDGEQCNDWLDFPDYPGVTGATGGFFRNFSIICGGHTTSVKDECIILNSTFTGMLLKMSTQRNQAASVLVGDDKLWITGGMNYSPNITFLTSTEYIQDMQGQGLYASPGPDLPVGLYSHQIVSFNSKYLGKYVSMLIGGQSNSTSTYTSNSTSSGSGSKAQYILMLVRSWSFLLDGS